MLVGYPPFGGETDSEVLEKVKIGNIELKGPDWKLVST